MHDLTDAGFDVGLDIITGATITIHLADEFRTGQNNETFRYDIGLQTDSCFSGNCINNNDLTIAISLGALALSDLAADGNIIVTITSLSGDFLFADSLLTAQVTKSDPPSNRVPEPAALLLVGTGLIGIGGLRRRRR